MVWVRTLCLTTLFDVVSVSCLTVAEDADGKDDNEWVDYEYGSDSFLTIPSRIARMK